jgi:peptidoglycan/LPS O-acetylase OafA/YrhL
LRHKNLELEYLRALAILGAVFHHLDILFMAFDEKSFLAKQGGGYLRFWGGVDLFFCISGYVVSKSLVEFLDLHRLQGNQWIAAQAFWVRRFYRLLPSAWFWLAFVLCSSIIFRNNGGYFADFLIDLKAAAAVLGYVGNLAIYIDQGLGPIGNYWSLALEEQFYLVFPFFLIITVSNSWRWKLILFLIAAQFIVDRSGLWNSLFFAFRIDALLWGILIYFFSKTEHYKDFEPRFCRNPIKALAVNGYLLFMLAAIPVHLIKLPISIGMMALACAGLVFLASFEQGYILPLPKVIQRIMLWIGSRSYAIYLTHLPSFMLTSTIWWFYSKEYNILAPTNSYIVPFLFIGIGLTLLFSEFNYRVIELPLRKKGQEIARKIVARKLNVPPEGAQDSPQVGESKRL